MTALLWLSLVVLQAIPDAQAATAVIRGRVTDQESGAPIARAVVRLANRDSPGQRVTQTDDDGRYEMGGLPAGRYSGFVAAGQHRATHLDGWLFADRRGEIDLKAGETRPDANVALARSRAMTVRVVDEWGEPLARVRISVKSADTGNTFASSFNRTTDDRGRLRIYQLPPGRYLVCADTGALLGSVSATAPRRERFLRTCYPSAAADAPAQSVRLDAGDLDEIVIQMRLGRTFRISGTILDAAGAPAQIPFASFTMFEPNGSSGTNIAVGADGGFTVANVPPGDYAIEARVGGPERPEQRQSLAIGFQPVVVDSADVDGLVVTMSKAVEVAGRFVLEDTGTSLPRPGGSGLSLWARLAGDPLRGQGSSITARAEEDRTFVFQRMFGKRTFEAANIPRGWYVKSIRYDGREIIDVPTELKAGTDPSALEVVLSNRGATVTGRVTDDGGNPVRGARVFLLPANPARLSRFPDYVNTSATGAFRAGPQRAGDYVLVALGPSGPLPLNDASRLAQLTQAGARITLADTEERTLDLTVVRIDR